MRCEYSCKTADHLLSRRSLLGGLALGGAAAGLAGFSPVFADLERKQKRILNVFLHGGVSQLETWDPKPNTNTGGPFRAIPTSVPGMHICELLPYTAKQMHHLAIIRSVDSHNDDHGRGHIEMTTGHKQTPGAEYPHLGAVAAKLLTPEMHPLPGHILVRGAGNDSNPAAYLGPKYASLAIADGKPPPNLDRSVPPEMEDRRQSFRTAASDRFAGRRRTADTDAYTFSYEQAQQLIARKELFDVTKEPESDHDRYGRHELGQQFLLARRLLEAGVPFVQVNHSNYDTHFENFDFHIEQLGEFDRPFATLVADLADRGLLADTLVVVMSEFGRTPHINKYYGRDHWGKAWSVCLGGAGIKPGAIIGKTNDNGTEVTDRSVDHGHLFHTYLRAVGVDSKSEFQIGGKGVPIADPAKDAIHELIA
jgi:hypothetical protein